MNANEKRMDIEYSRWIENNRKSFNKTFLISFVLKNHKNINDIKKELYKYFQYKENEINELVEVRDIPVNTVLVRTDFDDINSLRYELLYNKFENDIEEIYIFDIQVSYYSKK